MKEFIEKLIGRLEESKASGNPYDSYWDEAMYRATELANSTRNKTIDDTILIVNQLAEEYINCSTDTSTNTSSGWIHCSERLPEDSGRYLVDNGIWRGEGKFDIAIKEFNVSYVIAWQPLPAPYTPKEGRE